MNKIVDTVARHIHHEHSHDDVLWRGRQRIVQARSEMQVLDAVGQKLAEEGCLSGLIIVACLHVSAETANFVRVLAKAGAAVRLISCNPLSIKRDIIAALRADDAVELFCEPGRSNYYQNIEKALKGKADVVIDDGGDVIAMLHTRRADLAGKLLGGTEQTSNGVTRLKAMEAKGDLIFPVFAVNNSKVKNMFDNRFGTGQSTVDGLIRATNLLIAGKTAVVCGYGWCGRGIARAFSGLGAQVIVTEIDPIRALEASLEGYRVMPLEVAAPLAEIVVSATGNVKIVREEHFLKMRSGTILINAGHFDREIDVKGLNRIAIDIFEENEHIDVYQLPNGRSLRLLCKGRIANIVSGEGNPASVMDLSFSCQALSVAKVASWKTRPEPRVMAVPAEIEREIACLKLEKSGVAIDLATEEQIRYATSWKLGT